MAAASDVKTPRRKPARRSQGTTGAKRQKRAPWDKQTTESPQAFDAFVKYRSMAAADRSLAAVARELERAKSTIEEWSSKHRWVSRLEAWIIEEDRQFQAEMREERMRMARRHAKIAGALLDKTVDKLLEMDGKKLSNRDLATFVEVGTKVQRGAYGDPNPQRVEHSGPGGGPIPVDLELGDDELGLMAELKVIAGVLSERLGADDKP